MMNCKRITQHIVGWLKDYIEDIPSTGFIVGVSGGIDSALVSTLCALTEKNVVLLNIPIHQDSSQFSRATNHIDSLKSRFKNVTSFEIDLTETFNQFENSLPSTVKNNQLALANSRARLRMTTLYAIGQNNQCLVVGTGNKVEDFGVGFFTKYGDGGVDLNPIADLLKSEVKLLANYVGVDHEIVTAQPTDGLWGDDRNDEDQIGASYEELEWAMAYTKSGNSSDLTSRQEEVLAIYRHLNRINQHKMKPIPVCDLSSVK